MSATAVLRKFFQAILRPAHPLRKYRIYRLHLFAAGFAGTLAALAFLLFYYLTLGALPVALDSWTSPHTAYPAAAWAARLDLAQFIGSLIVPPRPTALTWWIGIIILFASLVGAGIGYALILSWDLASSSAGKGLGYGLLLFLSMGLVMWGANGIQPAVMRAALPDVGFFFLGWSGWATLQALAAFLLYGIVLSAVYRSLAK